MLSAVVGSQQANHLSETQLLETKVQKALCVIRTSEMEQVWVYKEKWESATMSCSLKLWVKKATQQAPRIVVKGKMNKHCSFVGLCFLTHGLLWNFETLKPRWTSLFSALPTNGVSSILRMRFSFSTEYLMAIPVAFSISKVDQQLNMS